MKTSGWVLLIVKSFVLFGALLGVLLYFSLARAEDQDVTRTIQVYWDANASGFFDAGDVGMPGQEVQLIVTPCDPSDANCTDTLFVIEDVTGSDGQVYFVVSENAFNVAACYDPIGCLESEGAFQFGVQSSYVYLPIVEN